MDLFASDLPDDGDQPAPEPGRTPPPARAPRATRDIDLGEWGATTSRSTPRRWLLAAAVVPWVVVVAMIMSDGRTAAGPPEGPGPTPASPPSALPGATPSGSATPTGPDTPPPPTPSTGTRTAGTGTTLALGGATGPTTRALAEGLAVVMARSWLSTRPTGPTVEGLAPAPGAEDRYVEHVAVEGIDHPARGAAVVTLRVVVLPVEGDTYGQASQVRVAVPIALDADHARPAGTPWMLAVDPPALEPPTTSPVSDSDLMVAAAEAVTVAGYRDVAVSALERTSGWAWVVTVTARAPGEDEPRTHELWLRSDVGRLVVAGTAPAPAARPPTADEPAPPPAPTGSPTTPSPDDAEASP